MPAEGQQGAGRHAVLHPDPYARLVHDARVDALEAPVPPAQRLLQEADGRAGLAQVRVLVRPRPDQPLAADLRQRRDQAEHGVAVAVGPAGHGVHRAADRGVVLAHGAVLPVVVAALVLQPLLQPEPAALQPLQPHLAPALADDVGIRRQQVVHEEGGTPDQVLVEQAAAHVVDVVGVAVVGGAQRDDALQLRWLQCGYLQAVEAAPGDADHAHRAGTPRLRAYPAQHLDAVVQLLLQVLVLQHAVRLAAATQVHAHAGIAMTREPGVHRHVALGGEVALAVGDVLQDGRHRLVVGRAPDARGQTATVGQFYPGLFLEGLSRELLDDSHDGVVLPWWSCAPEGPGFSRGAARFPAPRVAATPRTARRRSSAWR